MGRKELFDAALALPPEERLELASKLLASVEEAPTAEWSQAWLAECDARVAAVESGPEPAVAWEEAYGLSAPCGPVVSHKLRLLPRAEAELAAAIEFYEARRRGLGVELLELAQKAFERIVEGPHRLPRWRVGRREYRRLVLERLPFIVLFTYDDTEVLVVAFDARPAEARVLAEVSRSHAA